jgi:AcrR family transcriptional regulator
MSDVKPGRREMYAAFTKAAVLDAAKQLFIAKGYDATSVEDIARAAHASKGAVYHHFADKQAIFAEVFTLVQATVMHTAIAAMSGADQPWAGFEAATRAFLRRYVADEEARTLLRQAMGVLGWDRVHAIDEESTLPFIRATLTEFIRTDVIHPVPVEVAAELLFGLYCNGILLIAGADDPARTSRETETLIFTMLGAFKR